MKSGGVWGRVSRGYACTLGMLLSVVGCGEGAGSREEARKPPEEAPIVPVDAGTGSETGTPDAGNVVVEPGPEVDGGTSTEPDAGTPDGGNGNPPGRDDGGTDAGTPDGNDGGTSTPDAGVPPVSGGPARRGEHWRASYYAGVSPGGLAVGDFNGDGAPDVAVNNLGAGLQSQYKSRPGSFALLLNDGKGALQKPSARRTLPSSSGRIAAGLGDLNGTLDVVLGTRHGAQFLAGSGDGTFESAVVYLAHGRISNLGFWPGEGDYAPRVWAVGDSTNGRDGPRTEGGFHVLVPTESGLLWPRAVNRVDRTPVVSMLDSRTAAAVSDFNRDGAMDVALASERWALTRFLGTPEHVFTEWELAAQRPDFLATADVNGDGNADLVAVEGRELWTYLGRGDGNFATGLMTSLTTAVDHLVVADADADGLLDVVLPHRQDGLVSLWRGNGLGRFDRSALLATGRLPSDAAVADLDQDGVPELLVAEAGDNVISVYTVPREPAVERPFAPRCPMGLRDGVAGGRVPEPLLTLNAGVGTESVTVGDFDGNGHRDLALVTPERGVRLLLGNEKGPFQTRDVLQDAGVRTLAAGDFNDDGLTDLATLTWSGLQLRWSDGQGGFSEGESVPVYADDGGHLVAADFNRDGLMDLGATLFTPCATQGYVLTNQGGGVLRPVKMPDHNTEPDDQCGGPGAPTIADFNGDGLLDFVHVTLGLNLNYTTREGAVMEGEGFDPFYLGNLARSAGDVDGDGAVDLLLASSEGKMSVLRGDTGGTFQAPLSCRMKAVGPAPLEAVDVNGDGVMDLLGRDSAGAVVVVLGEGEGTYHPVRRYPLEAKPLWAAPVDLLGDVHPELVVLLATGTLKVFPTPTP